MNKQQWKTYYRLIRISRREVRKASTDMFLYGSGFVSIVDGEPKRIPPSDVYLSEKDNS